MHILRGFHGAKKLYLNHSEPGRFGIEKGLRSESSLDDEIRAIAYDTLLKVADATDPLNAEKALEDLSYSCRNGYGRWSISLPDDLEDEDFFNVCKEHRAKVAQLKQAGLLDTFLTLHKVIQEEIIKFLCPHFPVGKDIVHEFVVSYDPTNFQFKGLTSNLLEIDPNSRPHTGESLLTPEMKLSNGEVSELEPGEIKGRWMAGRWGFSPDQADRNLATFRTFPFPIYRDCMELAYDRRFPKKAP